MGVAIALRQDLLKNHSIGSVRVERHFLEMSIGDGACVSRLVVIYVPLEGSRHEPRRSTDFCTNTDWRTARDYMLDYMLVGQNMRTRRRLGWRRDESPEHMGHSGGEVLGQLREQVKPKDNMIDERSRILKGDRSPGPDAEECWARARALPSSAWDEDEAGDRAFPELGVVAEVLAKSAQGLIASLGRRVLALNDARCFEEERSRPKRGRLQGAETCGCTKRSLRARTA